VLAVRVVATGEGAAREAWRTMNRLVVDLERDAFLAGFRKAFALGGGRCVWCEKCDVSSPCRNPHQARPSMEACSIDVRSTILAAGWQYAVATGRESDVQWLGLVLLK
jgi:predicted metal-binding protein